jgi:hypothetical protein
VWICNPEATPTELQKYFSSEVGGRWELLAAPKGVSFPRLLHHPRIRTNPGTNQTVDDHLILDPVTGEGNFGAGFRMQISQIPSYSMRSQLTDHSLSLSPLLLASLHLRNHVSFGLISALSLLYCLFEGTTMVPQSHAGAFQKVPMRHAQTTFLLGMAVPDSVTTLRFSFPSFIGSTRSQYFPQAPHYFTIKSG